METLVLTYLERPVQFIVMRIGNVSSNSAPQLLLPTTLEVEEDTPLTVQLEYTDAELDVVDFELLSVSKLGNVTLSSDGLLTYDPCRNCMGTDIIQLSIRERPISENHTPLQDFGEIIVEIYNTADPPLIYFYNSSTEEGDIIEDSVVTVYIDSNRNSPAVLVGVASFDVDGYSDTLQLAVTRDGQEGSVGFRTRLDAVNVFESLPATLTFNNPILSEYHDYLTFLSSHVTYLPSDKSYVGRDEVRIAVRDSRSVQSRDLRIMIEVLPSLCENDGVCGGSEADPECEDIDARRSGFDGYNCSCLPEYSGQYCEVVLEVPEPPPARGNHSSICRCHNS